MEQFNKTQVLTETIQYLTYVVHLQLKLQQPQVVEELVKQRAARPQMQIRAYILRKRGNGRYTCESAAKRAKVRVRPPQKTHETTVTASDHPPFVVTCATHQQRSRCCRR